MPNWCDTTYKAVGTKQQVKKFYDLAMKSWNNEDNSGWLGHFVTDLGGDWEKVTCRGWLQDAPYFHEGEGEDYATCTIYCDTAWGELSDWREFIESKIDGLSLFYTAIEPGCGVYISNDDEYIGKVYVDSTEFDTDFYDEDQAIEIINRWYGKDFKTIEECMAFGDKLSEETDDILCIHYIEDGD